MNSIINYLNEEEKELIENLKNQLIKNNQKIQKISESKIKYTNDKLLKMIKYKNNLIRQTGNIKDDIYNLKIKRILENFFYKKNIIRNINVFNKDILQKIDEFNFGGTEYLYYKEINCDYYNITTNIGDIKELLKEGWIEKIYKGKFYICDFKKNCELIFDKNIMYFKPINLLEIRNEYYNIYIGYFDTIDGDTIIRVFNDLCDFDNFEEEILSKQIIIKNIKFKKINEISECSSTFCFSIDKETNILNKISIRTNPFEKELIKLLINL